MSILMARFMTAPNGNYVLIHLIRRPFSSHATNVRDRKTGKMPDGAQSRTPKTVHRPGCRRKVPISDRTLIRSAISDTFTSILVVGFWSAKGEPFREESVGFLLHRRIERDPRRMRQAGIAKRH
ncbi:hypothetical protein OKW43_006827 [Paraburkholderia sp. WC7.3g]|uniref:hypothetical protein n=1 Tax=Paraburkholderia sp. WC7.3g TaxID=2991070 RepID=UPI003D1E0427